MCADHRDDGVEEIEILSAIILDFPGGIPLLRARRIIASSFFVW